MESFDLNADTLDTRRAAVRQAKLVDRKYLLPFILVTSLFFMWVFAHNLNDILIRQFQKSLALSRGEAGFIQVAFYLGYFLTALPAGYLMRSIGYKNGILLGLLIFALGAALFYPAAEVRSYAFFLFALFVIATGATFLETAANPYITVLGDPATAAQRLNLAQSFNGLGGVLAPVVGGLFVFSGVEYSAAEIAAMPEAAVETWRAAEAKTVQMPYMLLAVVLLLIAAAIYFVRFPEVKQAVDGAGKDVDERNKRNAASLMSVVRRPHLRRAVVAQLFYVAAQVGIWSYYIDFIKDMVPATPEKTAANWLAASIFFFMVGRFLGTYFMKYIAPQRLLAIFSAASAGLCLLAITLPGMLAVIAYGAISFFMSIMFPTIFALGVRDLGEGTKIGSSLIIMSIIGGALCPPVMGFLADTFPIQVSLYAPLVCFVVVFAFACRGYRL